MKATGIVRRIDHLGRIVIPKEIRRIMRFNEGSLLEIFTNDNQVIFQKHSAIESMGVIAQDILESIYHTQKTPVIACDRDRVIAAKGISKEEIVNRRITTELEEILEQRNIFVYDDNSDTLCAPVEGMNRYALVCAPVIALGDVVGAILFLSEDDAPEVYATELQFALIKSFAVYFGVHLSD